MLLKSLYRYILGDWNHLSPDEIKNIPTFFEKFIKNKTLAAALKAFMANDLYERLFTDEFHDLNYSLPDNKLIMNELNFINKSYNYLPESISTDYFIAYRAYYLICQLVEELTESGGLYFHSNAALNAYKLLIVYGEEDVEQGFEYFDNYCQSKQLTWSNNFINDALSFSLRQSEKEQAINLIVWRKLLHGKDRDDALKFFYIAPEIEAQKGHAPFDMKQALTAAKSIEYQRAHENPTFATLCQSAFIPEEFYNQCLSPCKETRMKAIAIILSKLTPLKRKECLLFMPTSSLDFEELKSLLEKVKPEEEFVFIERFKKELINSIKTLNDFKSIWSKLALLQSQQQLVSTLTPDVVRHFITTRQDLHEVIQKTNPDYHHDFLVTVIGKDIVGSWINNGFEYKIFLQKLLPSLNQVACIKALLGRDKVTTFVDELYSLEEQIKCIAMGERYEYLAQLIETNTLKSTLGVNHTALISILTCLEQSRRLPLMLEEIGINGIREMMPQCGYEEAKKKILLLLSDSDKKSLLEALPTAAEKLVLQAKNKIISTPFATALMGMSGCSIILDDGKEKTVPKTVAKHWECILLAQRRAVSYEKALETMRSQAEKAIKKTGITYFSRSNEAADYYEWFEKNAKNTCDVSLSFEGNVI